MGPTAGSGTASSFEVGSYASLGVAAVDHDGFVLADIPGLIEGASSGAGLGTRFLGHVERCRVLLHIVDGTADDVARAYRTVRTEIERLRAAPDLLVEWSPAYAVDGETDAYMKGWNEAIKRMRELMSVKGDSDGL